MQKQRFPCLCTHSFYTQFWISFYLKDEITRLVNNGAKTRHLSPVFLMFFFIAIKERQIFFVACYVISYQNRTVPCMPSHMGTLSSYHSMNYVLLICLFEYEYRLRASSLLLVGLGGLGAEVCKNIVLVGVKSITLMDSHSVTRNDASSQFLAAREDLGKNVNLICIF